MLIIKHSVTISDNVREIFQSGAYEKYICEIMNLSSSVFPSSYKHIDNQSHGEADIVDILTSEKYELKLSFTEEQGRLLCSNNGNPVEWLKSMMNEAEEFFPRRNNSNGSYSSLQLYKILRDKVLSVSDDENLILFIPYPMNLDTKDSFFIQFTGDIFSTLYDELCSEIDIKDKGVYLVYLSIDGNIVLRDLVRNKYKREFIAYKNLSKYIEYRVEGFEHCK